MNQPCSPSTPHNAVFGAGQLLHCSVFSRKLKILRPVPLAMPHLLIQLPTKQ